MPFPHRPRITALPEGADYQDTGCSIHPTCLTCPEPVCRYDAPLGSRGIRERLIRGRALYLLAQHLSARDVSHQAGISIRTVFRLKRQLTHPH